MRNFLPVASLSTILGIAGFCGGLYLLIVGRMTVTDFGAVASICLPLLAVQEHPSVPVISTEEGAAVPVTPAKP